MKQETVELELEKTSVLLKEHESDRTHCEVYSRSVGYLRPVSQWNAGKQAEFKDRKTYNNTQGV